MAKIWANSGDSHFVEPENLFADRMPKDLADRMPRSVKDEDGLWETVYVDGQEFRRRMPKPSAGVSGSDLTSEEFKDKGIALLVGKSGTTTTGCRKHSVAFGGSRY